MFRNIIRLFHVLDRRARVECGLLLVPMAVTALMEMISIALIVPLVQTIVGSEAKQLPSIIPPGLVSFLESGDRSTALIIIGTAFASFILFKNIVMIAMIHMINWVSLKNLAKYQEHLMDLYLHMSLSFFLKENSATIVRNIFSSAELAFVVLRLALSTILELLTVAFIFVFLLFMKPAFTLIATAVILVSSFGIYWLLGGRLQSWGKQHWRLEANVIQTVTQNMGSIRDIKLSGCQDYLVDRFSQITRRLSAIKSYAATFRQLPRATIEVFIVTSFLVLILSMTLGDAKLEDLAVLTGIFGMAAARLIPSANRLMSNMTSIRERVAVVQDLIDTEHLALRLRETSDPDGEEAGSFTTDVRLEDVWFRYDEGHDWILKGINLTIKKGQRIAFIGRSGAGKSTVIDLITGLLSPQRGRILVDGRDLRDCRRWWQRHVGVVPQQIFLWDDSLRHNIAFGVASDDIEADRVAEAIRLANLQSTVDGLSERLDTFVGEDGVRLSGGQRQRVGIARALYRAPDVLVFDEATSSLDPETEREITESIDVLASTKTVLIIAHHMATIQQCDKVVLMEEGAIRREGRVSDILEPGGEFPSSVLGYPGTVTETMP